jgi:hypothetical protein
MLLLCASGVNAQDDALAKVALYNGTWKISIEHLATKYSHAGSESTTLVNTCWRRAGYYACEQNVDGVSKGLIVFTYDAAKNVYHTYPIPSDGGPAGSGTMTIDGNTWTFPWTQKDGDTTIYFRVVNTFIGSDSIQYRQEYSLDQKTWTATARGNEHRATS